MLLYKNHEKMSNIDKQEATNATQGMTWQDFKEIMDEDFREQGWKKKTETKEKDYGKKGFKFVVH